MTLKPLHDFSRRGYFGIAIYSPKTIQNLGTLMRSANVFGADFIATINSRYHHQAGDTMKTPRHVPTFHFDTAELFLEMRPMHARLVGVELGGRDVCIWHHPEQAIYVLGPEDGDLPSVIREKCSSVVTIPTSHCLNVAVAGSIIMYDRIAKQHVAQASA